MTEGRMGRAGPGHHDVLREVDPMLILILLIASLICLALAAFGVGAPRINLGWLGVALFVLTFLVPKL